MRCSSIICKTLADAIDKLLEKDVDHRFGSAAELEKFFEELVSWLNQPTKHLLPSVPRKPMSRRRMFGLVSLVAIASLLFTGAYWLFLNPANTSSPVLSKEVLWSEIQDAYDIASPDFRVELTGLKSELDQVERQLNAAFPLESQSLANESSEIGSDLNRIEQSIEAMSQ